MCNGIKASLLFFLVVTGYGGAAAQSPSNQPKASGMEADLTKIKEAMLGNWESIAPEVRPSAGKNADGSLKPFYLKRTFKYLPSDRFELEIVNSADPYGAVPLARIKIRKSTSLPMRATRSLPSPKDFPTCSTRSPPMDMVPGPSTRPRVYSERALFHSL